jgi:hypothetical protein
VNTRMLTLPLLPFGWWKPMANLIFPQLSSGAMAQYPIRKHATIRTIKNLLADGSMLVAADPGAGRLVWTLTYINLPAADMHSLQSHFEACSGPFRAFTFLDPTDNLLAYSADLTQPSWVFPAGVTIMTGAPDPMGGTSAFTLTNASAVTQQISQTLAAPANFQYCFSAYLSSLSTATCSLTRSSAGASESNAFEIGPNWSRISSSGALSDTGVGLTVGVNLAPAQSISLFGPQLEPQMAPSRFRSTYSNAGLYLNAHWAVPQLVFTAEGPNLFSTSFSIEASVRN